MAGGLGVDFLLVLSALLACYQLLPALEGSAGKGAPSGWEVVKTYWARRMRRVLPAYGATLALLAVAIPDVRGAPFDTLVAYWLDFAHCPSGLWRSLALLADLDAAATCGERGGMAGRRAAFGLHAGAQAACTAERFQRSSPVPPHLLFVTPARHSAPPHRLPPLVRQPAGAVLPGPPPAPPGPAAPGPRLPRPPGRRAGRHFRGLDWVAPVERRHRARRPALPLC